ncbi:hypothetical protein BK816_04725 [Boudabousia tangfeifanii]|uniref:Alkaline phosphatase family protein n=1 Tax=Boudabousia tangfeifanii TaxID=1912795 RepID=A0A1D9MKG4_9ACTO|nr:alkaline phosphatase family protein [Boudabousia tangfeifanii]AOZ72679.1 hypothetical protein BK816_04725 [Boudabousia tangfeifanii]
MTLASDKWRSSLQRITGTEYRGGQLVQLSEAIMASLSGGQAKDLDLGTSQSVMLLLIDGLGFEQLQQFRAHARNLAEFVGEQMGLSCVPATTTAALSTTFTGELPAKHRMLGYSLFVAEKRFNLLNFNDAPMPAKEWQACPTIFAELNLLEIPNRVVLAPKYQGSGLTEALFSAADFIPAANGEQRVTALKKASYLPGFTYGYWPEVDHAGHHYGVGSPQWLAALEQTDSEFAQLRRQMNQNCRLILVADHGMVNSQPDHAFDLASEPHLAKGVKTIAGEPRAVHVFANETKEVPDLVARWKENLGEYAWILSPEESRILHGGQSEYNGDFQVYFKENYTLGDSRFQSPQMLSLAGVHGSLTVAEMQIPLAWE